MLPARVVLLVSGLLALALPATAGASFSGSNGKVAWIDSGGKLMVDDPFDDQPATAFGAVANGPATSPRSAPSWSEDGTRLAFTVPIHDGDKLPDHSAV